MAELLLCQAGQMLKQQQCLDNTDTSKQTVPAEPTKTTYKDKHLDIKHWGDIVRNIVLIIVSACYSGKRESILKQKLQNKVKN